MTPPHLNTFHLSDIELEDTALCSVHDVHDEEGKGLYKCEKNPD